MRCARRLAAVAAVVAFAAVAAGAIVLTAPRLAAAAKPAPLPWTRSELSTTHYASAIALGRFDADSLLDIAVTDYGANKVALFLNLGRRGFARVADFEVGFAPQDLAVGDIDR